MTTNERRELRDYTRLDFYNGLLKQEGFTARMLIDEDGDGGYELILKDGANVAPVSGGLNDDELADEVVVLFGELVRWRYVVTYVSLSDSEPDANGYCEAKICSERHIAERVAKEWADTEMEEQKDFAPSMKIDGDKRIISWSGGSEKVIIGIHEERVKWV
jgi:hypothetical protein